MITKEEIEKLRSLSEQATPGPWYAVDGRAETSRFTDPSDTFANIKGCWSVSDQPNEPGWETDSGCPGYGIHKRDAEFIAACREAVPKLLDAIEALRGDLDITTAANASLTSQLVALLTKEDKQ
jgi:hypothetical protein